ncbi:SGNH/GDSL hydrolase family protein [Nonomuraea sp. NN258]|uniref:SGNH/GDSL hydrolase family protein n=1 Tax=Nonomuraea antri TaxID=2730852 RepID=UPI001568F22E|nr:SGNH/GDSL hydrolase family protein [Nonomuraea antri]NRQ31124.1 SGNH/GDSL hydrolase family protein [Nonomuraea antri]
MRTTLNRVTAIAAATAATLAPLTLPAQAAEPAAAVAAANAAGERAWSGAWAAAVQRPSPGGMPGGTNWSESGFAGHSIRQVVRLSTGGAKLRIRLSNRYGTTPLQVTGVSIAKSGDGAEVRPATLRPVTFSHARGTVIPAGQEAVSDAVHLRTDALDQVSVTLYVKGRTGPATFHDIASATSYRARGDHRFDPRAKAFTETSSSWYYLTGVDVLGGPGSVVTFGDSVTDGTGSTQDANNRYPDQLAERLAASGRKLGVLNAGISGNRVLNDSSCFGEKAIARFQRDVLDRPGVRSVIVMEGINDITYPLMDSPCSTPNPTVTAEQIIEGHRALIQAARAKGVKVVGGTIMPFKGNPWFYPEDNARTLAMEKTRDAVNQWIRTGGEYDAVVDFERVLADPADGDRLRPEYNTRDGQEGDWLHPNDAGLDAMAKAVDLAAL